MKPATRETLILKANGLLSKQVAFELCIHRRTVESRIKLACEELGAKNLTHAVALAMKKGLILASEIGCIILLCGAGLSGGMDARRGPSVRNTSRTSRREVIV